MFFSYFWAHRPRHPPVPFLREQKTIVFLFLFIVLEWTRVGKKKTLICLFIFEEAESQRRG